MAVWVQILTFLKKYLNININSPQFLTKSVKYQKLVLVAYWLASYELLDFDLNYLIKSIKLKFKSEQKKQTNKQKFYLG